MLVVHGCLFLTKRRLRSCSPGRTCGCAGPLTSLNIPLTFLMSARSPAAFFLGPSRPKSQGGPTKGVVSPEKSGRAQGRGPGREASHDNAVQVLRSLQWQLLPVSSSASLLRDPRQHFSNKEQLHASPAPQPRWPDKVGRRCRCSRRGRRGRRCRCGRRNRRGRFTIGRAVTPTSRGRLVWSAGSAWSAWSAWSASLPQPSGRCNAWRSHWCLPLCASTCPSTSCSATSGGGLPRQASVF